MSVDRNHLPDWFLKHGDKYGRLTDFSESSFCAAFFHTSHLLNGFFQLFRAHFQHVVERGPSVCFIEGRPSICGVEGVGRSVRNQQLVAPRIIYLIIFNKLCVSISRILFFNRLLVLVWCQLTRPPGAGWETKSGAGLYEKEKQLVYDRPTK